MFQAKRRRCVVGDLNTRPSCSTQTIVFAALLLFRRIEKASTYESITTEKKTVTQSRGLGDQ